MNKINIIITSGGTTEDIDKVRAITNKSTGALGKLIAKELTEGQFAGRYYIYYIYNGHTPPENKYINAIKINNINDLEEVTNHLLKEEIFAFIHAMAVSDFKPIGKINLNNVIDNISTKLDGQPKTKKEIKKLLEEELKPIQIENKISSNNENLAIIFSKNIKIIENIKKIRPSILLIGFKLVTFLEDGEAFNIAYNLLKKSNADLIVLNDIKNINENFHKAMIIDKNKDVIKIETKLEIAITLSKIINTSLYIKHGGIEP
ncbi:MAG: hypothetical protein FWF57_01595 [Defluviitaleaceae bacterium]|nr:hypothetical protein [Defluviitaleaceae bacterium]